jgi:hypothetical protein
LPERLIASDPAAVVDDALANWGSDPATLKTAAVLFDTTETIATGLRGDVRDGIDAIEPSNRTMTLDCNDHAGLYKGDRYSLMILGRKTLRITPVASLGGVSAGQGQRRSGALLKSHHAGTLLRR